MLFLLAFTGGLEGWEGRFEKCLCTYKNLPDLHRSICLKRLKEWGGSPWSPVCVPRRGQMGSDGAQGTQHPQGLGPPSPKLPKGLWRGQKGMWDHEDVRGGRGGYPAAATPPGPITAITIGPALGHDTSPQTRSILHPRFLDLSEGENTQQQENPGLVPSWASTRDGKRHREDI